MRPRGLALSPSPPLWVTYLCSRRQERYHFMSGRGRGFLPHPPSLGSAVREIESGKVACRRALIPGDEMALSFPIQSITLFRQIPPLYVLFPKMAAALFLSPPPPPEPHPSCIVRRGAKKAQGSCRVAAATPAFGAVGMSRRWRGRRGLSVFRGAEVSLRETAKIKHLAFLSTVLV